MGGGSDFFVPRNGPHHQDQGEAERAAICTGALQNAAVASGSG